MAHISEIMEKSQTQLLTLQEVLASYSDIELTEDEVAEALILAKRKKKQALEEQEQQKEQLQRRTFLTQQTNSELVRGLMLLRMKSLFPKDQFVLDDSNKMIFELLCLYFGNSNDFISTAMAAGINNPSLDKGIFLYGNFGTGKTWMMKLFCRNHRQCYNIVPAKTIADAYRNQGDEVIDDYTEITKAAVNDPSVLFQKQIGLYIDDIGTEDVKNNFGNKKNVIGDLIERKYFEQTCGVFFHASTNLTAEQLKQYYGQRVTDRMREIFNIIELPGDSRRK